MLRRASVRLWPRLVVVAAASFYCGLSLLTGTLTPWANLDELAVPAPSPVLTAVRKALSELAGRAKDMGSAAVFVLMMNVVLVWALVLGPRYL